MDRALGFEDLARDYLISEKRARALMRDDPSFPAARLLGRRRVFIESEIIQFLKALPVRAAAMPAKLTDPEVRARHGRPRQTR